MLPPIPSWDGLHPLIVHFPIALLLAAPLFVILGMLPGRHARAFSIAALVLMALGTVAAFVAVSTGEAAGELVVRTPEISAALERHEELAETTRTLFAALTIIFAAVLFVPVALRRAAVGAATRTALHGIFLVLYVAGTLLLVNTAHQGGMMVHYFGVQAMVDSPPAAGAPSPAAEREDD